MDVDAFLSDSIVAADGKLFVQGGGWNVINAPTIPYRLARVGIGLIIHIPYTATNQPHKFELMLKDADGTELPLGDAPPGVEAADGKVRRLGGEFNIGRPATLEPGDEQLVTLAINMDGLTFERADRYEFIVELDGSEEKRLGFRVVSHASLVPMG